jgi:Sir2- and TIR-associating SLOG family/SIR2-like domain
MMKEHNRQFYRDVLENLQSNSLAIFAGAGLSKSAGYVDWKGLLRDIADDLGLNIDIEYDLVSIAQFNVNKIGGRSVLNNKIISEFNEDIDLSENHRILARLPIHTYWTSNYDDLIERSLKEAKRVADVKHSVSQLNYTRPRRDAVVYKMHGDASLPDEAVLTKDDYERYFSDKAPFITALSGDLVSKLFVFIGFSFSDPNLDYILSRVRFYMKSAQRHHYYFIKKVQPTDPNIKDKADFEYQTRKQALFIEDLRRFKLQPIYVDTYSEITEILQEIENLYKRKTIFISGSAEEYGAWDRETAQEFIHLLSSKLIRENFRIVNGFGWGVGSAVINGSLEAIYSKPERFGEDQLIVKPFPQFKTGEKELKDLWQEYRQTMISYAGAAIFIFGNKRDRSSGDLVSAKGISFEFDIAKEKGLFLLPINSTNYISHDLYQNLVKGKYYASFSSEVQKAVTKLETETDPAAIVDLIVNILKQITQ